MIDLDEFVLPPGNYDARGEYVVDVCPACGARKKLYWNPDKAMGFCFGGSCGVRIHGRRDFLDLCVGQLDGLSFSPGRLREQYSYSERRATPFDAHGGVAWDNPEARRFLEFDRGLTETVVRAVPLGYRDGQIVVVLDGLSPEYRPECYIRCEDGSQKWMPVRPGIQRTRYAFGWEVFLREAGRFPNPTVVVAEGIFDILQTGLLGRSVAVMGSSLSRPLAVNLATVGARAVVWTDADAAGEKARLQFEKVLTGEGVPVVHLHTPLDPKFYSPAEAASAVAFAETYIGGSS